MTEPQQSASSAEALKGKRGLRRLINATGYSIKGIRAGLEHEAAFREEFLLAVILIPTALFLPVTLPEKALLVISVLLLLLVEILNSAIEAVVDRIGMEIHPLAGPCQRYGECCGLFRSADSCGCLGTHRTSCTLGALFLSRRKEDSAIHLSFLGS